jgi:formylglycine-generating enzyme required for sulfatase activity
LADGVPPPWACEWGQDRQGVFAGFKIGTARQRMRWIPHGAFTMGSPSDEPGHFGNEAPAHRVTISRGFWLGDTPCTQALWQAVMGDNPSRFESPDRPVESVSWRDVQEFLKRSEAMAPGLGLVLPTEAQWEYACRAETETAISSGAMAILGDANAPALDPIAWYAGNSGREFDLAEGQDTSSWPEKQYPDKKAGTRRVRQKLRNPWGLYDILGNVWEWCADGPRDYGVSDEIDPVGPLDGAGRRVVRGGSWGLGARLCRSACRSADVPGDRRGSIGFRCARGQA